jgi:hypothetical protein
VRGEHAEREESVTQGESAPKARTLRRGSRDAEE